MCRSLMTPKKLKTPDHFPPVSAPMSAPLKANHVENPARTKISIGISAGMAFLRIRKSQ